MTPSEQRRAKKLLEQQVEAISDELMNEFFKHAGDFKRENPKLKDDNIIFQGWAIQKIAGLQVVASNLAERVVLLESRKKQ